MRANWPGMQRRASTAVRIVTAAAITLTLVAAGATLAAGSDGGLDYPPVASFSPSASQRSTTVMLVDVQR
jgi:hypothetical protein